MSSLPSSTEIKCVSPCSIWCAMETVDDVYAQSKLVVNICIREKLHWATPLPVSSVFFQQEGHVNAVPQFSISFAELYESQDVNQTLLLDSHIASVVHHYNISPEQVSKLKEEIALKGVEAAMKVWETRAGLSFFEINIEVVKTMLCNQQDFMQVFMQEGCDVRLLPATPESVEALKMEKFDGDDEEQLRCTVCLEEFIKGVDVKVMPCAHMFHKDCIEPWLNKTNTCPTCRFQLPTSD